MTLNKSTGNMYPWITHTWNPIGGACIHDCKYCYMKTIMSKPPVKAKYSGNTRLIEKEIMPLGKGRFIFVQNCSDLFAKDVPDNIIKEILRHCMRYPENKYLFQSKNPRRFKDVVFPTHTYLATTLETDDVRTSIRVSDAPDVKDRALAMGEITGIYPIIISVEPVLDFNLKRFADMIVHTHPIFVSIGADSKKMGLDEPDWGKITALRRILEVHGIKVKQKSNLSRLRRG